MLRVIECLAFVNRQYSVLYSIDSLTEDMYDIETKSLHMQDQYHES